MKTSTPVMHPNVIWVCGNGVNCSRKVLELSQPANLNYFRQAKPLIGK